MKLFGFNFDIFDFDDLGIYDYKERRERLKKLKQERAKSRKRDREFKKMMREHEKRIKQYSNLNAPPVTKEGCLLAFLLIFCITGVPLGIIFLYSGITMPGDVEMARIFYIAAFVLFTISILIIKLILNPSSKLNISGDKNSSMQKKDNINKQEVKENNLVEIKKDTNLLEVEDRNFVTYIEPIKKKIIWNEELFIAELTKTEKGIEVISVVKEFLEWGKKQKFLKIWWGSGRITGRFYFKLNNVQFLHINTSLKISLYIQILKNIAPFDNLNKFEELLNRMKEIFGNFLNNEVKDKGITLPLNTLSGDKLSKFFSVLDWILNNIEFREKKQI